LIRSETEPEPEPEILSSLSSDILKLNTTPNPSKFIQRSERAPLKIPCSLFEKIYKRSSESSYSSAPGSKNTERNEIRQEERAILTFLLLKVPYYNGVIKNAKSRETLDELSEWLQISNKTLRTRLSYLHSRGLIRYDRNKNLHLSSMDELRLQYQIRSTKCHILKLTSNDYSRAKHFIKLLVTDRNFIRQKFAVKGKIIDRESFEIYGVNGIKTHKKKLQLILKSGFANKCIENDLRKLKGIHRKTVNGIKRDLTCILRKYVHRYEHSKNLSPDQLPADLINTDITLSCSGFARITGNSSKSSGYYLQQQLEKIGLLSIERPYQLVPAQSSAIYAHEVHGDREDLFSYSYPKRTGRAQRLYFVRCSNILRTVFTPKIALW
jgi:hypothetical protein